MTFNMAIGLLLLHKPYPTIQAFKRNFNGGCFLLIEGLYEKNWVECWFLLIIALIDSVESDSYNEPALFRVS